MHGDASITSEGTKSGESYIIVNPQNTSATITEISEKAYYVDKEGNPAQPLDKGAITEYKIISGNPIKKTFTPYENFWHGVGHIIGGPGNEYRAIDTENAAAPIHKPNPLPQKEYDIEHKPRHLRD